MNFFRKFLKITGIGLGAIVFLLLLLAIYNQGALKWETKRILPNGKMVDAGGYRVHVYTEGENDPAPTLVFLSGLGTAAPTYDFKILYRLLSDEYRIAVVEKAGYGYSDIVDVNRQIDTTVKELRNALSGAGIEEPYILLPHSMSGLEAVYWAQHFPDEVAGIVGMDMAVPNAYDDFDLEELENTVRKSGLFIKLGWHRIPGIYPLIETALNDTEIKQQRLLMHRNAVNPVHMAEIRAIYENAQAVKEKGAVSCPMMLFASDGTEIGASWIRSQEEFAAENHLDIVCFDCGHYIHHYKSGEMADRIKQFIENISYG